MAQDNARHDRATPDPNFRSVGAKREADITNPNISTENQPLGAAGRPSETLDRKPRRDPRNGRPIPEDYDPESGTRVGEENGSRAARERPGSD